MTNNTNQCWAGELDDKKSLIKSRDHNKFNRRVKKKLSIYLSGRIIEGDYKTTHEWRELVKSELGDTYHYEDPSQHESDWSTLVERDIKMIKDCDIVVCNAWTTSFGTPMELVYAKQFDKLVLTAMPNEHPWITYHSNMTFENIVSLVSFMKRNEQYIRTAVNYWKPAVRHSTADINKLCENINTIKSVEL